MIKVDNGGENWEKEEKKIMMKIVVTEVVASHLPECRATGMPTACAKMFQKGLYQLHLQPK